MSGGEFLGSLSRRLAREQPTSLIPKKSASVSVIFHDPGDGEHVLLIRRAEREGDPWSGQVAFPGGRASPADGSFEETARREAKEEVGLDLSSGGALFLGYMKDFKAHMADVVVVPSVFMLDKRAPITPNREVASYKWVPLRGLAKKEARSTHLLRRDGRRVGFPSLVYEGLVIWGLTERILSTIISDAGAKTGR